MSPRIHRKEVTKKLRDGERSEQKSDRDGHKTNELALQQSETRGRDREVKEEKCGDLDRERLDNSQSLKRHTPSAKSRRGDVGRLWRCKGGRSCCRGDRSRALARRRVQCSTATLAMLLILKLLLQLRNCRRHCDHSR